MRKSLFIFVTILFTFQSFSLWSEEPSRKTILVTGGAGFIGSHLNKLLHCSGYQTIVLDNLVRGSTKCVHEGIFINGDLLDATLLEEVFSTYAIDAVIHCAALTEVGESVADPLKYYQNNVSATINLLEVMQRHGVQFFVFCSTAAVYGIPKETTVKEDHACEPINPYGHTKLIIEQILPSIEKAYGMKYCCLRFFNAAGGDHEGILKNYKPHESNLIQIVLRSLLDPHGSVTIYGTNYPTPDGTGVRDFIHVQDLATALKTSMERLFNGAHSACYNLGNGRGYSVREVIATVEKVTGRKVNIIEGNCRPGDPAIVLACSEKARDELHWEPLYESLEEMIEHAWRALQ